MSPALEYLRRATEFLRERGVGNPRLEAEVLLADVLGVDRVGVYLNHDRPLSEDEVSRYRETLRRRGRREPLQHIRGRQEFFSREFRIDARALVPRPETECVVEIALGFLERTGSSNGNRPRVLDVGCGSGVIGLTLALERPGASVVATDVSREALAVAAENALRLGADVDFRAGDLFEPVGGESFDLIVSNPPYVLAGEIDALEPEVRDFDPRLALDGGPDGLGTLRRLAAGAPSRLVPEGALAVEIGAGQGSAVAGLFREAGFEDVGVHSDLAGLERVVTGRKGG